MVSVQVRSRSRKLLAFVAFVALAVSLAAGFAMTANAQEAASPSISSDKEDYAPGETVVLTGAGWQPGESVNVVVNDDDGQTWRREVDVTADEAGGIRDEFQLPDWFVARYSVTATGGLSGTATTGFTDGNVKVRAENLANSDGWTLTGTRYPNSDSCADNSANKNPFNRTAGGENFANPAIPNGQNESAKLVAPEASQNGRIFVRWTRTDSATFSDPDRTICVRGFATGERTYVANFVAAPNLSVSDVSVVEGEAGETTGASFTVTRSGNLSSTASVGYATGDGSAAQPGDYTATSGTANFAAGDEQETITVPVKGDNLDENDETFSVTLTNPVRASIGAAGGTGTITDDDDTPRANDDGAPDNRINVAEDAQSGVVTNVLANDTGLGDAPIGVEVTGGPGKGSATVNANKTITYRPAQDETGLDSYQYTITDADGQFSSARVYLDIEARNDAPVAADDGYTEDEGQTLRVPAPGPLANDTDVDSGALKVCEIRVRRNGSTATVSATSADNSITIRNDEGQISSDGTGAFTFNPTDPDYFGTFTFEYKACDAAGARSEYATVTITYDNVNDAPRVDLNGDAAGAGDAATFTEGGGGIDVDTGRDLLVTDADNANMQSGSVTLLNRKAGDVISINENLAQTLNINVANNGATTGAIALTNIRSKTDYQALLRTVRFNNTSQNPDTTNRNVEFEVVDNGGLSSNAPDSVVAVIEVNDAPTLTASNDGPVNEGGGATITGDASDPDTPAGQLAYQFDCDNDGAYEERPAAGVNTARCSFNDDGDYTVNVRVLDGEGGSDTASTPVKVLNVAPVLTVPADQNGREGASGDFVLGSFTDPGDDAPWSVSVDWGDGSETTTFEAASPGALPARPHLYAQDGNYTVTVTVAEAGGAPSDSKTFQVSVLNVGPDAVDDSMTTTELRTVGANLIDNDVDPGGDIDRASMELLGVEISPAAANGANALPASLSTTGGSVGVDDPLGNVTYAPNRGFVSIDAFRYKVCDDDGDCDTAKVDVTVGPVDCDAEGVIRGTEKADLLRGTGGNDVICAFGGNDRVYGGGGDDLLVGAGGLDRMWAEDGDDVVRGGAETDSMDAGLGDDFLFGDGGRDVMMGRGGTDLLEMRDNSAGDAGNGGAGTDTCSGDAGDRAVSCERR